MSFHPLMALSVPHGLKTVCELGNQTYNGGGDYKSTEQYYKQGCGYKEYTAIDINDQYGSKVMDLNLDLIETYGFIQQFDLVTNNGTGEHLFNQKSVFTNIHNLCKTDGLMLHILPFVNWLNHCFYNYHPLFFTDLAMANGYKIKRLALGHRWGKTVDIMGDKYLTESKKGPSPIRDAVQEIQGSGQENVMVIALLKKTSDARFKTPIQGKYKHASDDDTIIQRYAQS